LGDYEAVPLPPTVEPGHELTTRAGSNTADAIMRKKDSKLVRLDVRIPKSARMRLRQVADSRGVSIGELVSELVLGLPQD